MKRILIVLALGIVIAVGGFIYWRSQQSAPVATEITALQSPQGSEGFARATEPIALKFPQDHGPHPDYQTEWWYYTGNLQTNDGRRFGYQLTFFRRGITANLTPTGSDWRTNQIYFAHFAVTDAQANVHNASEMYSRGAAGLAGAAGEPYHVWIENWYAQGLNPDASNVHLFADDGKMSLDLNLDAVKPPVLHGNQGLSQKTDEVGDASYYVSFTRMPTQGTLKINGATFSITGTSWFDHEWGTTGLGPNAVGWDWFSIQLNDNREVMLFQIRNKDGSIEPLSSGTLVEPDGTFKHLQKNDVKISPLDTWTSPVSQGKYPGKWQISSRVGDFDLTLTPLIADQEMQISFTYWEGAVNIAGTSNGAPVQGQGYVELTGYAKNAAGNVGY